MQTHSFTLEGGRVIRHEEDQSFQLLKTSIVASIGKPEKYPRHGIFELDGSNVPQAQITYPFLVRRFYECGVDVIRWNLSHVDLDNIRETFLTIKETIVRCEGQAPARKRIAVLADLPGPKIRLNLKEGTRFHVGEKFTIHFSKDRVKSRTEAPIKVDNQSLTAEMRSVDAKTTVQLLQSGSDFEKEKVTRENVLGGIVLTHNVEFHSYDDMLTRIERATESAEGQRIVLGDGEVVLHAGRGALDWEMGCLKCYVVSSRTSNKRDEQLKEHIGITFKGLDFHLPSFTEEDRLKIHALLEADYETGPNYGSEPVVAFVALSFAQTADDILRAKRSIEHKIRELVPKKGSTSLRTPSLIAKIETRKGLMNRRLIIDVADGIMVARGDLGLQMEIEQVPAEQKRLIRLCNKRGKPAVTATEMLKSMTNDDEPTRAEGADVFNAIVDGSDAVMMSSETSSGSHPFHAIRKMIAIAVEAERFYEYRGLDNADLQRTKRLNRIEDFLRDDIDRIAVNASRFEEAEKLLAMRKMELSEKEQRKALEWLEWRGKIYAEKWTKTQNQLGTNLITQAAAKMSENKGVRCILAASTSGRTVRMISRLRPTAMIIGAAHDPINTRRLSISYGVLPICIPEVTNKSGPNGVFEKCQKLIAADPFLSKRLMAGAVGQVIFTAGTPLKKPGTTNLIQTRELHIDSKGKRAIEM